MNKEEYDYILVKSKTFNKYLNKLKQKVEVNKFDQKDDETIWIVNNFIVGFSKYYSDIKITTYYVHKLFTYVLEEEDYE